MRDDRRGSGLSELLLEHVPAAVALFDREMRYLACSRRWLTDYRLTEQAVIGQLHRDVFPELSDAWRDTHRRALAGETLSSDGEAFYRADGSLDWVQWKIMPWREDGGEIGGVVIFSQLLTDSVESKRRARSLSSELNMLIDSATRHAICLLDPEGRVMIWNAGAERLYGWSEGEIVGQSYAMMFAPDDDASGLPASQIDAARRDGAYQGRSWRVRKDATRFLADVSINRIDDDTGAVLGFGQVVRDITQEAEFVRMMEENAAHQRSILDTVPDAMITIDECGIVQSFSAAAQILFGYTASEVVGQNIAMLMPEPDASQHDQYLARYRATGERRIICNNRRVLGRRKNGTVFPHALYVGEAHGGGRRIFTGFLRDLTAQEEAEAQLRELQNELIHIARVSAVGTMSTALAHELNQPLMAITNYMQSSAALLARQDEKAQEMVREALEEAGKEALRAGAIVQRLREFVSRGELERTIVLPRELALQACELGAIGAKSRGISCDIKIASSLRPVLVDRVQVQQVMLNLIRNACEALGNSGTIVIDGNEDGGMVHFRIIDDGPGVEAGKTEQLFEPFISSKASGMGMGLAISRTIIEAHGGKMWCEPAPGAGAAFHFTIPLMEIEDA